MHTNPDEFQKLVKERFVSVCLSVCLSVRLPLSVCLSVVYMFCVENYRVSWWFERFPDVMSSSTFHLRGTPLQTMRQPSAVGLGSNSLSSFLNLRSRCYVLQKL